MLKKGVSPLIAMVLIISISVVTIILVLTVVIPAINRAKEAAIINEAIQNMKKIDNAIRKTAEENIGSQTSLWLRNSGGEYKVNEKANSMDYVYYIKYGVISPGTFKQDGNLILTCGLNAKTSEYDFDGDGSNELVLENEILRVGLLKNGTKDSQTMINTSGIIKILNLKETDVNVTPTDSSVMLDDFTDTSYGTGYSELIRIGDHLPKAEAVFHINTTYVYYDIVYSLQSGADFLSIKIQNAYFK